jgi:hypothetical protein
VYNNIRLYPFDTDEDEDEEVQLNESIRVCVTSFLVATGLSIGIVEHYTFCCRRIGEQRDH